MTDFIDKIKEVVTGFLASENDKYITTEGGFIIRIIDHDFVDKIKIS
jgi:hypothetical protein